jgi:hypothetical protein
VIGGFLGGGPEFIQNKIDPMCNGESLLVEKPELGQKQQRVLAGSLDRAGCNRKCRPPESGWNLLRVNPANVALTEHLFGTAYREFGGFGRGGCQL